MKVLVTGKGGQLAWELAQHCPANIELVLLGRAELDISDATAVKQIIALHKPDVVINAAAYTAVDKAETDQTTAYAVNEKGATYIAQACKTNNCRLLHVSTDFVFDGSKTTPYQTDDLTNPLSVYGASKLAGDLAVQTILPDSVIVRTAWVYSVHGNNFVKTMLRFMAEKPQLGIVYDQVGTPTWAAGLARWLWAVAAQPAVSGVFHWTDAGVASWYDFAMAIQELGLEKGLLTEKIPVRPIPCSAYPTPAKRPSFSVIDKTTAEASVNMQTIHWRTQLANMLDELKSRQEQ
ncbi:dTDP-4-dehydrorhamnose reductase [Paraglaciecola hydrolytica]|uniref:dTDP-4-dehydrorhamnose reductase n=1 Tax=Paraglaciecola hydrolytica TaxID=1799789 RepID=A0A148KLW6_9ALTE|nr:dTDP-4-dehydrorhamnose reductase [Paraglaciecola hydrolytica]KXI27235.1 dTDP-4-dehydrorhamnose reductase [Paraglaciecola hydrolytica]